MRVLHLIDEPYDSGIAQYALRAAEGLARRGLKAEVWGLEGGYPVEEARRRGIPARGYSRPWLSLPRLRRALAEASPDLLVAHTGSGHTLAVALAAWHRGPDQRSLPVVRVRADARRLKARPGRRFLWRRTAGFVAANRRILLEQQELFGSAIPAEVVYEGAPDPGPPHLPFNGPPTVGILGRLDPVKGHGVFLQAAARVLRRYPDARFLVVGRQENVRANDLLREAHRLGAGERVELTGHVPDPTAYLRRCHVGVVASVGSEAVSRAAVEWMACGRPLVATSVGCLPEYVEDGRSGFLVEPRSPEAMAEALGRLVGDVFLRERMGHEARGRYEAMFTLERFLDRMEEVYKAVLARTKAKDGAPAAGEASSRC